MRCLRIIGIVIGGFIRPICNHLSDPVISCSSGQILSNPAKLASRMLELTIVSPLLSKSSKLI